MTNREKRAVTDELAAMAEFFNRAWVTDKREGEKRYRNIQGAIALAVALKLPHRIVRNEEGFITHIVYGRDKMRQIALTKKELIK